MRSPFARLAARAARVRAAIIARSYWAKASTMVRSNTAEGSAESVPSPAAETMRAPASAAMRSSIAAFITSRARRSRFATTSTPAPCTVRLARAATSSGRSAMGAPPLTPASRCHATTSTPSRAAHATTAARWASGPSSWRSVDTRRYAIAVRGFVEARRAVLRGAMHRIVHTVHGTVYTFLSATVRLGKGRGCGRPPASDGRRGARCCARCARWRARWGVSGVSRPPYARA